MLIADLLTSTGLEKSIVRHDLYAAVNRYIISEDDTEMVDLTREQHAMYLIITKSKPGDALWKKIEEHLGETLE